MLFVDVMKTGEAIALGFQHYILALGTAVMIPSFLVPLMGGDDVRKVPSSHFFMFQVCFAISSSYMKTLEYSEFQIMTDSPAAKYRQENDLKLFISRCLFCLFFLNMRFETVKQGDKVRVVQTLLFVEGINTLLQTLFGTRLPTVIGGSYAFMVPIISIIHDSSLARIEDPHLVSKPIQFFFSS